MKGTFYIALPLFFTRHELMTSSAAGIYRAQSSARQTYLRLHLQQEDPSQPNITMADCSARNTNSQQLVKI